MDYAEGKFLERKDESAKDTTYRISKRKTYFFKESIVHPFIQFKATKKGNFLPVKEYVEILNYVENNGLSKI